MTALGTARAVSTVAVASIAAWSSWSHMVHVALHYGERPEVAYVLPISVDGMLLVASTVMVDDKRTGSRVSWPARIAFAVGVAASVAANIAAAEPTVGARIVAAWPAVALLVVVEMLSKARTEVRTLGSLSDVQTEAAAPSYAQPGAPFHHPPGSMPDDQQPDRRLRRRTSAETAAAIADVRQQHPEATTADIATSLGVSERHVRRLLNVGGSIKRPTSRGAST